MQQPDPLWRHTISSSFSKRFAPGLPGLDDRMRRLSCGTSNLLLSGQTATGLSLGLMQLIINSIITDRLLLRRGHAFPNKRSFLRRPLHCQFWTSARSLRLLTTPLLLPRQRHHRITNVVRDARKNEPIRPVTCPQHAFGLRIPSFFFFVLTWIYRMQGQPNALD